MSDALSDAARAFARKRNIPTELLSADFDLVNGWLKERAFWLAGVADGEILQGFRREVEKMLRGESGGTESMGRLWDMLERKGYKPPEGTEGTIKDLRTWDRMSVSLDTNVSLARGYGMRFRAQQSLRAFPAWRFFRLGQRMVPRKWEIRWDKAAEATAGIPGAGDFVALINHPIWRALSAFGTPYPIFDYGSGMNVKAVPRSEAKKIGLLDDPRTDAMWKVPRLESPNATLQAKPDITERKLRQALSERLKGLARWEGDILVHTDPNGTRPMTARQLADVWRRGLPDGFEPRQKQAFIEWVQDSRRFNSWSDQRRAEFQPGTDRWDDFLRFIDRLENEAPADALWRGMSMDRKRLDGFLEAIKDGYTVRNSQPAESWTSNQRVALNYAAKEGKWRVVVKVNGPVQAKDITPLVREFSSEIAKQKAPTVEVDAEWLYRMGTRFRVVKVNENASVQSVEVTLEELPIP